MDFWLSTEDLPSPGNRVTLNSDGNVILSYTPNNREPLEQLYHRVKKHLSHLGMHPHHLIPRNIYMKNDIPVAGCAHQVGTVRFGTDPATSVLDPDCKAHELDNLYVVDTSFFPSIGARSDRPNSASSSGHHPQRMMRRGVKSATLLMSQISERVAVNCSWMSPTEGSVSS